MLVDWSASSCAKTKNNVNVNVKISISIYLFKWLKDNFIKIIYLENCELNVNK